MHTTPHFGRLTSLAILSLIFVTATRAGAAGWSSSAAQRKVLVGLLRAEGIRQMHPDDIGHLRLQLPTWKDVPDEAFFTVGSTDPALKRALTAIAQRCEQTGCLAPLGVASITSGAPGNGHPYVLLDSNAPGYAEDKVRWTDATGGSLFPSTGTAIKQSSIARIPTNKGINLTLWLGPREDVRRAGDAFNQRAHDPKFLTQGYAPGDCAQTVADMMGLLYSADSLNPFAGRGRGIQLTSTNNAGVEERDKKGHYGLHAQQGYGFVSTESMLPPVFIHIANPDFATRQWASQGESKTADGYAVAPAMGLWIHKQ